MYGAVFSLMIAVSRNLLATFLTGLAVKIVDDQLDEEKEAYLGIRTFGSTLGTGTGAYAILLFSVAVTLSVRFSVPFFLACYIAGMFHELRRGLPSGLKSWQESFIVFAFGCLFFGLSTMIAALGSIICLQLIDDWVDIKKDQVTGLDNLILSLGKVEAGILGLISLLTAVSLSFLYAANALLALPLILMVESRFSQRPKEASAHVPLD